MASFFRDESGQTVLVQKPNKPVIIGLLLLAADKLVTTVDSPEWISSVLIFGAYSSFFYWSWLEASKGVNGFRKLLGWVGLGFSMWLIYRRFLQ